MGTECAEAVRAHAPAVTDVRLIADLDVTQRPQLARPGSLSANTRPGRAGMVSGRLDGMVKMWAYDCGEGLHAVRAAPDERRHGGGGRLAVGGHVRSARGQTRRRPEGKATAGAAS